MNNQSIINGLKKNDKATIRYIFQKISPMLAAIIQKNGGSQQDIDDVFMNTLEVMYLKVREDDFTLSCAFSTLFCEVGKRQWWKMSYYKNRNGKVTSSPPNLLIEEHDLLKSIEKSERYQLYRQKFRLLTENCQKVLQLWLDGKSMLEIATIMRFKSDKYARKRKFVCKQKLIDLIQDDDRFKELTKDD